MIRLKLNNINKSYFKYEDVARALGISNSSAMVTASRYTEAGILIRLKRNLYMLSEKWNTLNTDQLFGLANLLQVPSYVSLMTALSFYEITTQIQQGFIESIALKRTKSVNIKNTIFAYSKIKPELYIGFYRDKGIFIAKPEKAFLDALYLKMIGRYTFDLPSIDLSKLDKNIMNELAKFYPMKIKEWVERNDYSGTT